MERVRSPKEFLPALILGSVTFFAAWVLAPELMNVAALLDMQGPTAQANEFTSLPIIPIASANTEKLEPEPNSGSAPKSATKEPELVPRPAQSVTTPEPVPRPVVIPEPATTPIQSTVLFHDAFTQYSNGLITNEYAHWNPSDARARDSDIWEMTAGSLFANGNAAWTGVPDSGTNPDVLSTNANNSAIFRLTTKRSDFEDVKVEFDLNLHKLTSTSHTPAVDWDGAHVFLRYQSQYHLYYASINRRDDTVIIKKKVPGGPSNGGTYHNLGSSGSYKVPYDAWQHVEATIQNNSDGSVTIELFADGKKVASATDNGIGGLPIRDPGKVGIRGDNADMHFKNFTVTSI